MLETERLKYLEMINRVFVRAIREGVDCDNPTLTEGQATKLLMDREERARAAGFSAAKEAAVKVAVWMLEARKNWLSTFPNDSECWSDDRTPERVGDAIRAIEDRANV